MKTETFDNAADFWRAANGTARRASNRARQARPDIPRAARAARGEGDRLDDLGRLAKVGYTCTHYEHATGEHWLSGAAGESPRMPTYRAALDAALREVER